MKSVAAFMPPPMRKNLITSTHLAPGSLPPKVVQKPEIGVHWKMLTRRFAMLRQEIKMAIIIKRRRYCETGKMRYWKKMMENFTPAMAKV